MSTNKDRDTDVTPTLTLAKLYEKQGFLDRAAEVYEALISQEPQRQDLRDGLENLKRRRSGKDAAETGKPSPEAVLERLTAWQRRLRERRGALEQASAPYKRVLVVIGPGGGADGGADGGGADGGEAEDAAPKGSGQARGQAGVELADRLRAEGRKLFLHVSVFQPASENELAATVRDESPGCDALVIDLGRYLTTGMAVRDAVSEVGLPIVEVHPGNPYSHEWFHRKSLIGDLVTAQLSGFGRRGYVMAVRAAKGLIAARDKA